MSGTKPGGRSRARGLIVIIGLLAAVTNRRTVSAPANPRSRGLLCRDLLERGHQAAALVSEKARSEFLIAPVLLAAHDFAPGALTIYSGQRLDVDPERGLLGECDYILALTPPVPRLRAPLVTVLEAKKGDVEAGLGQCVAQMVGARLFNERTGEPVRFQSVASDGPSGGPLESGRDGQSNLLREPGRGRGTAWRVIDDQSRGEVRGVCVGQSR